MNVFADAVIRLRWLVILIFLAISAFFALQLPSVEIDPEVKNQLPSDMPARLSLDRVEDPHRARCRGAECPRFSLGLQR